MNLQSLMDEVAERALVACCILWPSFVIDAVQGRVSESDFTHDEYGPLYGAVVQLYNAGRPVDDLGVLVGDLAKCSIPKRDLPYIAKLTRDVAHRGNAVYYADRIRDLARLRAVFGIAAPLQTHVLADNAAPDDVLCWLESQIARIRCGQAPEAQPIHKLWREYLDSLEADLGTERKRVLLSGFPAADRMGFVFAAGELTVIAARTGVGKTSMASQIGMHHAKHGRRVMMASLEMGGTELGARMILAAAGKNNQLIRQGEYTKQDVNQLRVEAENIGERPFYVYSPGRVKVGVLNAASALMHASTGLDFLIIDQLSWIVADNPKQQRHEQIGETLKGLLMIAKRLQIPVLLLCQLNREADGERPTLRMLRESGDIEQDAHQVAFIHPDPKDYSPNSVDFIIAKNRSGSPGTIQLDWCPEATRFSDPSTGREWQ